ncbi:hypothetical protein PTI98_012306 [Pleurotus ostreatus]|nr:hypothetical protein PTI98_012306 [Pleurotus ostreatus]
MCKEYYTLNPPHSEHHPFEFAWVRKNIDTPLCKSPKRSTVVTFLMDYSPMSHLKNTLIEGKRKTQATLLSSIGGFRSFELPEDEGNRSTSRDRSFGKTAYEFEKIVKVRDPPRLS